MYEWCVLIPSSDCLELVLVERAGARENGLLNGSSKPNERPPEPAPPGEEKRLVLNGCGPFLSSDIVLS